MKRWTLGFIFNQDFSQVLLIHKQHPEHQRGKWNGLGGKYEGDETGRQCIAREVKEESDLAIPPKNWLEMGKVGSEEWEMDVFTTCYKGELSDARTTTDEEVAWFPRESIPKTKRNLFWLIPLCYDALAHDEIARIAIQYTPSENWK